MRNFFSVSSLRVSALRAVATTTLIGGVVALTTIATPKSAQAISVNLTSQDSSPFSGITYRQFTGTITRPEALGVLGGGVQPLSMHAMVIDLNAPGISLGVTAPNADGLTSQETTLNYAKRVNAQISINANFFNQGSNPTVVEGRAASNGTVYGSSLINYQGAINFTDTNQASLFLRGQDSNPNPAFFNAVTGNMVLINGGQIVNQNVFDTSGLFARTAMGVTADNKLILLVADGPAAMVNGVRASSGLNHIELATILRDQFNNLSYAINLDGGGSTGMVMCPTTTSCNYVNQPSRFSTVAGFYQGDRPVGNNFGVFVAANAPSAPVPVPPQILGTLLASGLAAGHQLLSHRWDKRAKGKNSPGSGNPENPRG